MANITTRASKGAPLSWNEADANFINLNTSKLEVSNNLSDVSNPTAAKNNLGLGNVDNTSDINKPISAATQIALNGKQDALPSQTGNNGKFLGTNGTTLSWNTVDALPSQTGNNGKFLTTNGTTASWATLNTDANTITIKSNPDGVSGAIQVNGVDKVTIGASGITAGSFAPNSIDAAAAALAFSGSNVSLTSNGYQKLPSGLIIQWGSVAGGSNVTSANVDITFPVAFPTMLLQITGGVSISNADLNASYRPDQTTHIFGGLGGSAYKTGITASLQYLNNIGDSRTLRWIAIGY